jgi:hypothetical protein
MPRIASLLAWGASLLALGAPAGLAAAGPGPAGAASRAWDGASPRFAPPPTNPVSRRYIVSWSDRSRPPYNAVFKIVAYSHRGGNGYACVAAAISRHLLLTTAHCVEPLAGGGDAYIEASYEYGLSAAVAYRPSVIFHELHRQGRFSADDYAVLYVPQRLPAPVRPFRIDPSDTASARSDLEMIGFSSDVESGRALLRDPSCRAHPEVARSGEWSGERRVIFHDCSFTSGASGSPLIYRDPSGDVMLVGIHASEFTANRTNLPHLELTYDAETTNIAIKASTFYPEIAALLKRYPD